LFSAANAVGALRLYLTEHCHLFSPASQNPSCNLLFPQLQPTNDLKTKNIFFRYHQLLADWTESIWTVDVHSFVNTTCKSVVCENIKLPNEKPKQSAVLASLEIMIDE
jgi:hypothetical protein